MRTHTRTHTRARAHTHERTDTHAHSYIYRVDPTPAAVTAIPSMGKSKFSACFSLQNPPPRTLLPTFFYIRLHGAQPPQACVTS